MTNQASSNPTPATLSPDGRRFLEAPRFAVVATINPDGSVLQAVVWYDLLGDTIVFNSRSGRRWPANLERDPRSSFLVEDGQNYVEMRGEAEIDKDPVRGQKVILELARRYEPERDPAAQAAAFAGQHRVTFELRPTRIFERLFRK